MNKSVLGALIALVVVAVLAGGFVLTAKKPQSSSRDAASSQTQTPATNNNTTEQTASTTQANSGDAVETSSVSIQDFSFSPRKIKVKKGTKVTWTNKDSASHDITPDTPSDNFKGSDLLAKDESYSFTFEVPGTYSYHCSPHPNMTASVEVVE